MVLPWTDRDPDTFAIEAHFVHPFEHAYISRDGIEIHLSRAAALGGTSRAASAW